ncbi:MAG: hypothetical protein K0R41_2320, partial [Geminicoccaceae bacterium]|nr:hypothetical protein [Geminicoccaceae bacterium]
MRLVILAALSLCLGVPAALEAEPRLVALGREIAEGAALGPDYA